MNAPKTIKEQFVRNVIDKMLTSLGVEHNISVQLMHTDVMPIRTGFTPNLKPTGSPGMANSDGVIVGVSGCHLGAVWWGLRGSVALRWWRCQIQTNV